MENTEKEYNLVVGSRSREDGDDEIDLLEILHLFLHKAWLLALCFIAGAVILGLYTKFMVTPMYSATSTIYVLSKTTSLTSVADLQLGSQLTADYQMLGTSRLVVEQVIENMGLNMSYGMLASRISISNPTDTHFLRITVSDADPQLAADISNAMAEELSNSVAEVMVTEKPSLAEVAIPASMPYSPNIPKQAMIGGLIGFCIAAALILLRFFIDDTIKTTDDIQKELGINTLAIVPLKESTDTKFGRGKRKKRAEANKRSRVA